MAATSFTPTRAPGRTAPTRPHDHARFVATAPGRSRVPSSEAAEASQRTPVSQGGGCWQTIGLANVTSRRFGSGTRWRPSWRRQSARSAAHMRLHHGGKWWMAPERRALGQCTSSCGVGGLRASYHHVKRSRGACHRWPWMASTSHRLPPCG